MSYQAEVRTGTEEKFATNNLRFSTEAEAALYAKDLTARWTAVTEWRVVPSQDEVNRKIVENEGHLRMSLV